MPWISILWMLLASLAALVVGNTVGSWLAGVARAGLERAGVDPSVRRLGVAVVRPVVLVVAIVAALGVLGVDTDGLVVIVGALTLAVGLALRSSLSNVASGGILLTLRPYREGDRVQLGGQVGTVLELGLYGTTVRGDDGTLVTLPNDLVLAGQIHNYTRLGRRRVELDVTLPADAELDAALESLVGLGRADARVQGEPEAVVTGFAADGAARVAVRAWVSASDHDAVRSDLHRAAYGALRGGKPSSRARAAR